MNLIKIFLLLLTFFTNYAFSQSSVASVSDDRLLGNGNPWFYHTQISNSVFEIKYRSPNMDEEKIVKDSKKIFDRNSSKAIALVDGNTIVYMDFKSPTNKDSLFHSYSIGKTVNSMGIGKAICSGKLSLNDVAENIVPELKGTDLGKSTVRDLLRMSSGTTGAINSDSSIISEAQFKEMARGNISWLDILSTPKVNSYYKTIFGNRKNGQYFDYHSTDPLLLGVIINKVTGMNYAKWIEQEVLLPAGIGHKAIIGQDRFGYGNSDGAVRMTMEDWIRFANYVKNNEMGNDCFANYIKEASKTQISNEQKREGKLFDGYGYLIWTENARSKDSYWAVGYGGQRIGWNHKNNRMLIVFSNVENYMDDLYWLYKDWANLN